MIEEYSFLHRKTRGRKRSFISNFCNAINERLHYKISKKRITKYTIFNDTLKNFKGIKFSLIIASITDFFSILESIE